MKVVINACYGGFSLSPAGNKRLQELKNDTSIDFYEVTRNDPALVQVVEELGTEANGAYARLKVVNVPDGTDWEISEYDGNEHVAEVHRTWD